MLSTTNSAFVYVWTENKRPGDADKNPKKENVAMLYAVGPIGKSSSNGQVGVVKNEAEFLAALETLGKNVIEETGQHQGF